MPIPTSPQSRSPTRSRSTWSTRTRSIGTSRNRLMTPSPRSDRPRIYADEDIDRPLIEALRMRGFDVLTVQIARSFGEDDLSQLERATALGRVLLTFNRRHFRRPHARWIEGGRAHPSIV